MIIVDSSHYAWPWLREYQVSFSGSFNNFTTFLQKCGFHSEKWEGLNIKSDKDIYDKNITTLLIKYLLTADPGFILVAPGNGVIT